MTVLSEDQFQKLVAAVGSKKSAVVAAILEEVYEPVVKNLEKTIANLENQLHKEAHFQYINPDPYEFQKAVEAEIKAVEEQMKKELDENIPIISGSSGLGCFSEDAVLPEPKVVADDIDENGFVTFKVQSSSTAQSKGDHLKTISPEATQELIKLAHKNYNSKLKNRHMARLVIPHWLLRALVCIPEGMMLRSTYTDPQYDGLVCILEGPELPEVPESAIIPRVDLVFESCETCGNPKYIELLESPYG